MPGLFDNSAPKTLPTPGTAAYEQAAAQDQAVYNRTLRPDTFKLRDIALGMAGTAGDQRNAATTAIGNASSRFDVGAGGAGRAQRGLGNTPDAATSTSNTRRMGLARVLAQVDAGNRGARGAMENRKTAQQFGTQFWGDTSTGANSILAGIARSETERNAQYVGAQGSAKAAQVGLAGSLISMI